MKIILYVAQIGYYQTSLIIQLNSIHDGVNLNLCALKSILKIKFFVPKIKFFAPNSAKGWAKLLWKRCIWLSVSLCVCNFQSSKFLQQFAELKFFAIWQKVEILALHSRQ